MFEPSDTPRVFGVAPGIDFPAALIAGLRDHLQGQPPHAMAQVDLIVNTRRMARRLRTLFDQGPPGFLPRIHLVTQLEGLAPKIALPPATPGLRRRLELIQLVSRLLDTNQGLAPRASLYGLSDSLATLIDEMQGEGVTAADIKGLDVTTLSQHWENAKQFLGIAQSYLDQMDSQPDAQARQRMFVTRIAAQWQTEPPTNPVIVAGSTGSRGTTSLLMNAVAQLPQGALILPGFDHAMPPALWTTGADKTPPEDHPQYRFFALLNALECQWGDVGAWSTLAAPSPARNALVSLSLRPAPVTDTWLDEGPKLGDLTGATQGMTLIEAPTPRVEALAIAMRLRKAVQDGQTAALITPDRMLTRQVTAALDRWNILPDDSAGTPLQLSPPGRFMRHVTGLFTQRLDAEALLTLLKHPLTHSGTGRNEHQLNTLRLEAQIRRDGLPFPDADGLRRLGDKVADRLQDADGFNNWINWIIHAFCDQQISGDQALGTWADLHISAAERVAAGQSTDANHELWKKSAGQTAKAVFDNLIAEAAHGGDMSARDYADLIAALLSGEEVRDRDAPHPDVMIWGTLEARVQGADLVILGGLNDGTWPEAPPPDPWLNRQMRFSAGLLLPERRVGLSAHDYQQAIAAPEVWLTRAIRSDDAETVPSRWISRLLNLLNGLPMGHGAGAVKAMQARGKVWLDQTTALEAITRVDPAPRPSPRPPLSARPSALSVTEIKRLIRDPYSIYARHCLRLRPINPLVQSPDAPVRGIILHQIMEDFVRDITATPALLTKAHLLSVTQSVLDREAPWPTARIMWRARIARIADWFIAKETARQSSAKPVLLEDDAKGTLHLPDLNFTLIGKADRIDMNDEGQALVYDYKTGAPPTPDAQKHFDKQLLLEAAMLEEGAFETIGPAWVAQATFIGLGSNPDEKHAPLATEPAQEVLAGLRELIGSYQSLTQGFTSRRLMQKDVDVGDYDQLARFGEWDGTTLATPEDLT